MKYCHNCGKQLDDYMKFCPACGQGQDLNNDSKMAEPVYAPASVHVSNPQRQLHCPHCKSVNIQSTLESQTTDGGALHIPLGNGIGISNISGTTTQHYDWLCLNCGIRFPNIHELEQKLASLKFASSLSAVCAIIAILGTIYYLITNCRQGLLYISLPCIAFFSLIYIVTQRKIKADTNVILFYQKHCFD